MRSLRLFTLLLASLLCSLAFAQSRVQAGGQASDNGSGAFGELQVLPAGQDTVAVNPSRPGVSPSASLTLTSGELRAAALLSTGSFYSNALAVIEDTIFISGDLPGVTTLMLLMAVTGTIDRGDGPISSSIPGSETNAGRATASLQANTFGLGLPSAASFFNSDVCPPGFPFACQVGTSFADVVALPILVDNDHRAVLLTASLIAEAFNGADVDFGSTGRLMLSLPSGLGFTSASGLLLTIPVTPVPEPSTFVQLIAGLGILATALGRARRSSPIPRSFSGGAFRLLRNRVTGFGAPRSEAQ